MARSANGDGSVFRRGNGRWYASLSYVDAATGESKRTEVSAKTRREVLAKRNERRDRIRAGAPVRDSRETLGRYVETWIAGPLGASSRRDTTKAVYRTLARTHLGAETTIGATSLAALRPSDVERLLATLTAAGKAQGTVQKLYGVLRAILDTAVRDGLVSSNVAAKVKRPRVDHHEAEHLSPQQLSRLLEHAPERWRPFFRLLARTGLRRGEALALRWDDVDTTERRLYVRGTLATVSGVLSVTPPKTARSRRSVPLSAGALAALDDARAEQAKQRETAGESRREQGFVFTTALGAPIDPNNAYRALTTAAKAAGMSGIGLHTLRHTAASAMLSAGVPIHEVSRMLGHSSVAITGDVYGHVAPDLSRRAADELDAALG